MNDESTPKGAHESATTALMVAQPTDSPREARRAETALTFEDRHAAFVAGYESGLSERIDIEIEDQIQGRIHDRVREALGMARKYAAAKGPSWLALITECGELDD